ncbi:hypothetical protein E2C01_051986 [Portunus trituberculatus]|uniref:Uncharacterized protein n=1 Tax=Portunus trituberculatus TaxID=210409 RepID=A0A5B7GN67_PORTR|nr:hypothetical protein [Portunus trituberculatus]
MLPLTAPVLQITLLDVLIVRPPLTDRCAVGSHQRCSINLITCRLLKKGRRS